jgi:hypothetical protein
MDRTKEILKEDPIVGIRERKNKEETVSSHSSSPEIK